MIHSLQLILIYHRHKNGETVLVQPVHVQQVQPIQQVQQVQQVPVQYVVKESQYRAPPQPQFVQTRADANYVTQTRGDANYVAAPPGRPVSHVYVVNI